MTYIPWKLVTTEKSHCACPGEHILKDWLPNPKLRRDSHSSAKQINPCDYHFCLRPNLYIPGYNPDLPLAGACTPAQAEAS